MPQLYGYYQAQPQVSPAGSYLLNAYNGVDEATARGTNTPYVDTSYLPTPTAADLAARTTATAGSAGYTNGNHFAGTNVPMSDAAYRLLTSNGGQIATDRDVLGGGKYGIRGWMTDHPLGVIAAMIAAAAGGAALSGGAAAGGAGGAGAGGGSGVGLASGGGSLASDASLGAAANAGVGTAGIGTAGIGSAALPEIVVTGTVPAGLSAGEAAGLGAGAAGAGSIAGNGTQTVNTRSNLANDFQHQVFGDNAQQLAADGGIQGGAGANSGTGVLGRLAGTTGGNMSWTDWIGPLIQAGSSIYGSRQASNATTAATNAANAEQRREFDLVRGDTAGQRALGDAAINTLADLNGYKTGTPDLSKFYASPDYNFNLTEGQKAIDRSLVAKGGALSGAGVKAGERYASGLASKEYSAFVDRLLQQAGVGATGIGASAAAGANSANNISSNLVNAGNTRASIYMNNAANINNAAQSGMSNYVLRKYLGG